MFENEVTLTFIFQTIAVILVATAIGIFFFFFFEKKGK